MESNLKEISLELDIHNTYTTMYPNQSFLDNQTIEQLKLLKDKTLQLHNDIKDQYTIEYNELLKNYNDMSNDRDKYKNIADNLSKNIQEEQDNLRQTMKYINSNENSIGTCTVL